MKKLEITSAVAKRAIVPLFLFNSILRNFNLFSHLLPTAYSERRIGLLSSRLCNPTIPGPVLCRKTEDLIVSPALVHVHLLLLPLLSSEALPILPLEQTGALRPMEMFLLHNGRC